MAGTSRRPFGWKSWSCWCSAAESCVSSTRVHRHKWTEFPFPVFLLCISWQEGTITWLDAYNCPSAVPKIRSNTSKARRRRITETKLNKKHTRGGWMWQNWVWVWREESGPNQHPDRWHPYGYARVGLPSLNEIGLSWFSSTALGE